MKRFGIMLVVWFVAFALCPFHVFAEPGVELAAQARSAVLMDALSGKILFEKNSHEKLPPASITKVMTMLLIMEALDQGKISLKDKVRVSEKAATMGGSQIFLEPGEEMSVEDMLKAIAVASANDAAVAMAEHIGGTEEHFVELMNKRAAELGLKNTHFQNSNGLPADNHYSSAHDIAVMSRELLKHPEITKYTGIYEDYLRKNSPKPFWLVNTNKLVRFYPGVNGLKTGFTSEARFCLTATAKRDHMQVIAVVMGEPDSKIRNKEVSQMLDYAFNQYTNLMVYKKGDLIARKQVPKGKPEWVEFRANRPLGLLIRKGEDPKSYHKQIIWNNIEAPIKKGQVLGKVQVSKEGRAVAELELISTQDIQKASMWSNFKKTLRKIFFID
ncbi:D-alanyl-D-alanine carboxypeptidase (penicillin-binding protein 5/6) [Thermoflavimicrobium dichotomicum]|uniref:serine-type D-Ala-D-Ala carboxypeptidase n=2 Tax=Thermoflavimicrobium dichotomicum TaxID=46223 RepID=A0A1I3Q5X2_9BACL|nr:D-alanyl-D-alanine carboxypeptidase (penicillin-binding protein 5/6) [Thermoflavimicrobium dichotomicum]